MKRLPLLLPYLLLSLLIPAECPAQQERTAQTERPAPSAEPQIRAVTAGPEFHWFSYYDVAQFDPGGRYLLGCAVDFEHRSPRAEDRIEIGLIDLHDGDRWRRLGHSRAWCWQQGCRLQWRPGSDREVLWNDREEDRFVCRVLDVRSGAMRTLPRPVYHVSPDGRQALGTDFARIQHMRPGYGYAGVPDRNRDVAAPEDSGIYRMDMETGRSTLLFSIAAIAAIPYPNARDGDRHYFNHIEWNPDGTRFLFLHRWRPQGSRGFRTRMFTADADGNAIRLVTDRPAISHYTWFDARQIVIHRGAYRIYRDDGSGRERTLLQAPNGHQSMLPGNRWMLTDTYPAGPRREQELYLVHLPTGVRRTVGRFPAPAEYRGEWRVDLHPRISPCGTTVVIDSAHGGTGRQMYLIDIADLLHEPEAAETGPIGIEAEESLPGPGLAVDASKGDLAGGGKVLGVHADEVQGVRPGWPFVATAAIPRPALTIRYASPREPAFRVLLDRRALGIARLRASPGWGYRAEEWRSVSFELIDPLIPGRHLLELEAVSPRAVNLDRLSLHPAEGSLPLLDPVAGNAGIAAIIRLPSWKRPGGMLAEPFELGTDRTRHRVWGRGVESRFHFDEELPALFSRTLVFEQSPDGRELEWIFTGPRGGITLGTDGRRLRLVRRFYDSRVCDAVADGPGRHPEWSSPPTELTFHGGLKALTVTCDHRMGLRVEANGREVVGERFCLDLSRHQLSLRDDAKPLHGRLLRPAVRDVAIAVEPDRTAQTMIGFGGIATPTAYARLSPEGKMRWWRSVCEYNLLVQREYPIGTRLNPAMDNWDRLEDATPHYYGDNFPNGEISDFAYLRAHRSLGGSVWFEFWQLPPWVGDDPELYAKAMLGYCRASVEKAGAPPDVVGIQNEVTQTAAQFQRMTLALRTALDRAGFGAVRIHMSDSSHLKGGLERIGKFRADPTVWRAVDYAATHLYDFQKCFHDPDSFDAPLSRWRELAGDKPFLSTEMCINAGELQWPGYRVALTMGQLYHKNLAIADAAALCYCWTLLNVQQPSYGWTRTLFVVDRAGGFLPRPSSHQLRVFGAFSRRIRAGMRRVEAQCDNADLLVTAYRGEGGLATLVAVNRSAAPCRLEVDWPGAVFTEAETVSPCERGTPRLCDPGGPAPVVVPGAILTLTNVPLGALPDGWRPEEQ